MSVNPYEPPAQKVSQTTVARIHYRPYVGFSLVVYCASFFLPVFDAGTPQVMYGYQAFAFALISPYLPCWLANPMYWLACRRALAGSVKSARNCAAVAFVLSISQMWMLDDAPEIGFYLWSGAWQCSWPCSR